jgi:two-component system chemotaxis response regulator CheB
LTPAVPPDRPPPRASSRPEPLRVLIAEDSLVTQQFLADRMACEPDVQVAGRAADGEEALRLALQLQPDLICLDLEMPRMNGFTVLRVLMAKQPAPVIVVSSNTRKEDVFKALELGALDFVAKPEGGGDLSALARELASKLTMVRALRVPAARRRAGTREDPPAPLPPARRAGVRASRLVVIGASTGGPAALSRLFASLPPLPLAFAVAQHMPERFTATFAQRLAKLSGLDVLEAEGGMDLVDGRVLVSPGGWHLKLSRAGGPLGPLRSVLVARDVAGRRYCPSVDLLFESAAEAMGSRVCAVVLTGMGNDGRSGVEAVKEAGGRVLAESEESAVVYGMPKEAVETGKVDAVIPLAEIPARLARFAEGR